MGHSLARLAPARRVVIAALALALAAPVASFAQEGRIAGTVRSANGTPLSSARIGVTNGTGVTRSTTSDSEGRYAVTRLPSGGYTVTATLVGFRPATQANVRVPDAGTVDFTLDPLPLQAITVTATLREQELADVPFSIAAPTAVMLRERGADNIEAIAANVAGFSVQNLGPGQSQVAVRGASSGQIARDQPGVKESVGAYLDDAPVSLSLFTPDLDLFDVARVEVLRGPQGTLFGAGSLSGTVRYITNKPELGQWRMFGEAGGSQVGSGGAGGTLKFGVNVPLASRAAARVALYHNTLGGWQDAVRQDRSIDENVNSGHRTGVRAAIHFAPNDRFSITPRIVAQQVGMDGWNRTDAFNILANPYTTSRPAVTLGPRQLYQVSDEPFKDNFVLGDLNASYDFGGTVLSSITSVTHRDIKVSRDGSALYASIVGGSIGFPPPVYTLPAPFDDRTKSKVWTQELRLAGSTGRTTWLLGAFHADARRDYGQSVRAPGFEDATGAPTAGTYAAKDELFFSDLGYDLRQTALFGEGTFKIGPRLDLTAGLRYYVFSEERTQIFDGFFVGLVEQPGSTDASGLAPRFIASFKASDNLRLNAQVSRGFRLGGINDPINVPICTAADLATFSGRDSWRDEKVWNYELGGKATLLGGRASLNLSAFYMDISDLQLTVTAGSCSSRLVFNVPARSRGAEFEFAIAPNPNVDLSLSASYNNSVVRSTLTSTDADGQVSIVGGISRGNRLPSVPRLQGAASTTLRRPLRGSSLGFATGTVQYIGSRYTLMEDLASGFGTVDMDSFAPNTIGGPLTQRFFHFDPLLPAYTQVNLRAGVRRANWEAAIFVNNLTDVRALLALDRERGTLARVGYLTNQPRTIGVGVSFDR